MRKIITPCLIASIVAFSPALQSHSTYRADNDAAETPIQEDDSDQSPSENPSSQNQNSTMPTVPQDDTDIPSPEASTLDDFSSDEDEGGTHVGQAASEGSRTAKRRQMRNIALAVAAVALAVTALILVSSNSGRHSDD